MRSFYKIYSSKALQGLKHFNFFLFLLVIGLRASAATYPVTDFADGLAINQLRGALKAADDAGGSHTITLAAGTYNLTLGEVVFGNKAQNITIIGAGSASTTINMTTTNQDRIFLINPTGTIADVTVSISGIKFTGGRINISSPNNCGPYGGGAILGGGPNNSLAIINCIFQNNTAPAGCGSGGAIAYNAGGTLNIDQCTFTGNLSQDANGGAVSYFLENSVSGSVSLTNSIFTNNSVTAATASGGAVFIGAQGTKGTTTFNATVTKNTFTGNTALSGVAGAIIIDNGFSSSNTVLVNYNRFTNNTAGTAPQALGMNSAQGHVDATNNWWGCNGGPAVCTDRAAIVSSGGAGTLNLSNWLQLKATATPAIVCRGGSTLVTASFLTNSAGAAVTTANLSTLIGQPINFTNPLLGTASGAQTIIQANGTATATFTAGTTPGAGSLNAVVDNIPNNDAIAKAAVTINAPLLSASQTNVSCFGGSNGTATVTVSGSGTAPYTYDWTPGAPTGDGTASITGLAAGTYTVAVTDANSCTNTQSFTITQPSAPLSATASSQTNVSCNGGANGVATVAVSGGTPGYTYSWAPSGGTAATASGLAAGTYTVTVTDANLCQTTQSFTITQPAAALSGTTVVTNVACNGGNTGAIDLTPSGGTPPYTYNWGSGITTQDRINLVAGNYSVTITDANGCTSTVNATVSQPSVAVSGSAGVTNVFCNGGSNGSINLTPSGGVPPYTYDWGEGINSEDRTGLVAGTYIVTITDANGCTATRSFTITQPTALVAAAGAQTNVSCNGGVNGSATVSVTGGTPGYTYLWAPVGGTGATASGLVAGTYTVTVTDANACKTTQSFTITQPSALTATTSQTNVFCNGGSNGMATVNVSGGTAPYAYAWSSGGGTAATATGLVAGTYTCTVTDAKGCTLTRNFTITQPPTLTATSSQVDAMCNIPGQASVVVSGGTAPYTYSWSPSGGTAATATGLVPGTYTVTIEDINACQITKTFTIVNSSTLTATTSQTNVSCNGGANGTATVVATGGVTPYTYSWSPSGGTGATATGLVAGTYTVTITDGSGCSITRTVTITQPSALVASAAAQTNIVCNGAATGSATVAVSGGTPGYTYSWAPSGGTAATATGLIAGTYTVTVRDANACIATQSFTITQPAGFTVTTSQTNVSCNGGANGTATVSVSGGTGSYTYSWAPSGGTGATATGLAAGTYTVTITDANACTTTRTFTITQPSAFSVATSQTNVACNGESTGSATVAVSGATGPYTYSWAPSGGTAATASGLTAGTYTVTITDFNDCSTTRTFTITQPAAALSGTTVVTNIACNGGNTGAIDLTPSGSTAPYTYDWSDGITTQDRINLVAGNYSVTITDANGCTSTVNATVSQPPVLTATTSQTNIACNGAATGIASVNVSGGTPGYTYSWAPSGGTGATASGLAAGTYTVTITDANLCTTTRTFTITQPSALVASAGGQTNVSCNGGANGSATVSVTGGTPGYTYSWAPSGGTAATASGLAAGTYTVTVTDANNCTTTQSFTITQPSALTATTSQTNIACNGGTNGVASVLVSGGTAPYTYSWSPSGGTAATASGLAAGTYTVTITDNNNCQITKSFTITQPAALSVSSITVPPYGTYTGGDNLDFTINFSQPVTVVTSGGLPYLEIVLGNGTSPANYISGSGSNSLVFRYTVGATDQDPDGLSLGNIISNGGLLQYGAGCTAPGVMGGVPATTGFIIHNPVAQTITFNTLANKTYGDADFDAGATASSGLAVSYTSSNPAVATIVAGKVHITGAGSTTITASQPGNADYLPAAAVSQSLTVSPKVLTVTATAQTKTYGEADPALSYSVTGLVGPDLLTGNLDRIAGNDAGTYAINLGTLTAGINYSITYNGADLTIVPKAVTVTAMAQSKTYGDADPALSYTVTPALIGSDAFSGALSRVAGEEVGVYAIHQNTLALSANYILTYTGAGLTITKKAVTIAAEAKSKTYGDADPVLTYTVSPALVSGDVFTGNLSRTAGEGVGSYAINQNTLALNGNYAITYTGANLSIGQKTVTVTANAKSKTYGDADPALTYTVSPALVSGDAFTGSLSRATGENVGSYAIHQNTLSLNSNYVLNYTGANFTIGKKAVTVTADAKTKTYGTADPAFTYAVSPALVNGDVLTGALSRAAGEDVGSYAINQGSLNNNNYSISFVSSALTITKAAQQITWNQTLVAGCDGNTTIALTATASSGLPVAYQSANTAVATINGAQLQIAGPGSSMITATQPGNNNYLPAAAVQQELTSKLPAQLMVKRWDDVLVFDNSSNQYTAWQWYKNGSAINGATGQYYHESSKLNGDYYAVVKTTAGTTMQTCPVTITPGATFIPISIFPNPVDPGQTITVKTGYSAAQLQGATIVVTNMLGAVVQTVQNVAPQTTITMPVAQGLYAIRLKLANGVTASVNALVKPQ